MSTKNYEMSIGYNNDKTVNYIPVMPESIQVVYKGITNSVSIDRFGEVLHKGKREGASIKFSSFFPAAYDRFLCSVPESQFKTPKAWNTFLIGLEEKKSPCHFVLTGSPLAINIYADIINYSPREDGGDPGTIQYSLELKEHREPTIAIYKKSKKGKKKKSKSSGKKRTNNSSSSSKKYKVNCSALHLRTGPNATILALMPCNSVVTSDEKTNGNWLHVLYGKQWGYAYKSYLTKV